MATKKYKVTLAAPERQGLKALIGGGGKVGPRPHSARRR